MQEYCHQKQYPSLLALLQQSLQQAPTTALSWQCCISGAKLAWHATL